MINPACGQSACGPVTVTPTCTDGIQNGNEEGIDCGGSCPNGYWVDITQGTSFTGGFYHKCVTGTSTSAPAEFGGFNGATGTLIFQKGTTYYARVYNG